MSSRAQYEAVLQCHPDTPCAAVVNVKSAISWERGSSLRIVYTLNGAIERLLVPPRRSTGRRDGLWQHTCFELFLGAKNDAEYYEFNFSPSGEWAAYGFRDYRDRSSIESDGLEPKIAVEQNVESLELSAGFRVDSFLGISPKIRLLLGLCAVIEDVNGSLSYWALKHPPGKPDFHHPDGFALEIVVPG
jgi:hypothetical protein